MLLLVMSVTSWVVTMPPNLMAVIVKPHALYGGNVAHFSVEMSYVMTMWPLSLRKPAPPPPTYTVSSTTTDWT